MASLSGAPLEKPLERGKKSKHLYCVVAWNRFISFMLRNILTDVTLSFALSITFGTPFCHKHTHTHTRTDTQHTQFWIHKHAVTPCLLPSNQFETLLSETFFNVPLLFLLPLLFNTLLYYPLISSLSPPCFFSFICFEHSGKLYDFGSSHHARRFQQTGDLRDTDTLQTALTNGTGHWKNRHPLLLLLPPHRH